MMQAYGLKTHIWKNNTGSVLLLIFFPILLLLLAFGLIVLWTGFTSDMSAEQGLSYALNTMPSAAPIALGAAGAWFGVAFLGHQKIIDIATKSKSVTISQEPRAYRMLENLSISRGQVTPKLMRNRDVRLLIIAVIFVGIFSFVGEGLVRGIFRTNLSRNDTHRRSGGGNAGALIFFAFVIIAVAYLLAMLTRFALSRKREYMADAGAVELTKNPDAMIRALQKISGRAELTNMPAEIKEMAFENPRIGFAGVFATHPPIEKRIEALVKYAGGRIDTQSRPQRRTANTPQNHEDAS